MNRRLTIKYLKSFLKAYKLKGHIKKGTLPFIVQDDGSSVIIAKEKYKDGILPFSRRRWREIYFTVSVIKNSRENALSLIKEAEVLLKYKYYARALALSILAFEEIGKSLAFYEAFYLLTRPKLLKKDKKLIKRVYKYVKKSHVAKIKYVLKILHRYRSSLIKESDEISQVLCRGKEYSLYVDYEIGKKKVFTPKDVPIKDCKRWVVKLCSITNFYAAFCSFVEQAVKVEEDVQKRLKKYYKGAGKKYSL